MCLQGNSAPLSIHYLNAQLSALWDNAKECTKFASKSHIDMNSQDYDTHKYTRALSQFHFAGRQHGQSPMDKQDLLFDASFGRPRLDFICNHEAVLFLMIEEGHMNRDYQPTDQSASFERTRNVPLCSVEVAFAVEFTRRPITGQDSKIGNDLVMQIMILDLINTKPAFLSDSDLSDDDKEGLVFYLGHYLQFLRDAGHHVLFDLPHFDNDKYSPHIDYSSIAHAEDISKFSPDSDVFEVRVSDINDYLRDLWLGFASQVNGIFGEIPGDRLSLCMAEIMSRDLPHKTDLNFFIIFAPLEVKALCKHEAIIYFTLDQVFFYDKEDDCLEDDTVATYADWDSQEKWRIAFIVNVHQELGNDGTTGSLILDWKSAHLSRSLSVFSCTDEIARVYFEQITKFLSEDYIDLIALPDIAEIFHAHQSDMDPDDDIAESEVESEEAFEWTSHTSEVQRSQREGDVWTEEANRVSLRGFDQFVMISEDAINTLFRSLWSGSRATGNNALQTWFENGFDAKFGQMKIQLLSGERAIVFVNIDKATMSFDGRENYDCARWSLAFEVQLRMVDHQELMSSAEWVTNFEKSSLYATHSSRSFKHFILDLHHCTFVQKLSYMDGLFNNGLSFALVHLHAAVQHARAYLRHISTIGFHLIYSVPLFTAPDEVSLGLTSVTFQIVTQTTLTVENCRRKHEPPVILVLGMCNNHPAPTSRIEWSDELITRRRRSGTYSTLCLSKDTFLKAFLLDRLALINAQTTVLPRHPRDNEKEDMIFLTTCAQTKRRKKHLYEWKLRDAPQYSDLEYYHDLKAERKYLEEIRGDIEANKMYSIVCHTRNQLIIPTTYHPECLEMLLHGESFLRLFQDDGENTWSKRASAKWDAYVRIYSLPDGLNVEVSESIVPVFSVLELEGNFATAPYNTDLSAPLREQLPTSIGLEHIATELQDMLEGSWKFGYAGLYRCPLRSPVFTRNGDLVIQLLPQDLKPVCAGSLSSGEEKNPARVPRKPPRDTSQR